MINILMCQPTYYAVQYKINPWMDTHIQPDTALAHRQWDNLLDQFKKTDVQVHLIDPQQGLPDMVFTANAGLVFNNIFIVSRFRYPQRQKEADFFLSWFKERDYEIKKLPEQYYFEGEGDALFFKETLIAGYRYRSDIHTHRFISEIIEREVLSVELTHPSFYHLDTCFCPLDQDYVLYYPGAFDAYGVKVLENIIPNLVAVSDEDAHNFCCNAVVLGKKIILNQCSDPLKVLLEDIGFQITQLAFSEFIKAGGSSKCMTLFLDNPRDP